MADTVPVVMSPSANRKYHVKAVRNGSLLTLFVDGREVLSTEHKQINRGRIGLLAPSAEVRFDNLSIYCTLSKGWLDQEKKKYQRKKGK